MSQRDKSEVQDALRKAADVGQAEVQKEATRSSRSEGPDLHRSKLDRDFPCDDWSTRLRMDVTV